MKLLVDMNLSPTWCQFLAQKGFMAVHWSEVGAPDAPDAEIMRWARDGGYLVLTQDLDFGIALAHTRNRGPSVIQIRSQNATPSYLGLTLLESLRAHQEILEKGALLTVDEWKHRVRVLPI